jgi:basic amino acid/polyamine antiporter, APA family
MPFVPIVPCLGIIGNYILMGGFDLKTWFLYMCYLSAGLAIYFGYGMNHSVLQQEERPDGNQLTDV